jgi:hypothetical protein
MTKININVFDNFKIITEEVTEIETSSKSGYIELNNVYVEITDNKQIVYLDCVVNHNQIMPVIFKSKSQINDKGIPDNIIEIEKCSLLNTYYPNVYYHWIYDILPQLSMNEIFENISFLALPFMHSYQVDSLKYFAPNNRVYSNRGFYRINRLFIGYPTTDLLMPKEFVFDFFRKNEKFLDTIDSYIYITRKKGLKRRILNEPKLIKYLKSIGFVIYSLEDITFGEQKKIFTKAKFILSAHGSGLTNIIFSNPNCNVIEIYGPGCGERCFARIAHKLRINYCAIKINELAHVNIFAKLFYKLFPNNNPFHFRLDIELLISFFNFYSITKKLNIVNDNHVEL